MQTLSRINLGSASCSRGMMTMIHQERFVTIHKDTSDGGNVQHEIFSWAIYISFWSVSFLSSSTCCLMSSQTITWGVPWEGWSVTDSRMVSQSIGQIKNNTHQNLHLHLVWISPSFVLSSEWCIPLTLFILRYANCDYHSS